MSPSSASSSSSPPTPPAAANPTTASSSSQPSQPALSYGSQIQMRTRKQNNFAETEASLPRVTQHRGAPLLDDVKARLTASTKLTDLLSYLGPLNPLPLSVARDDAVWLFDNVAFPDPQGDDDAAWRAEFVAAVFEQHVSDKMLDAVTEIADKVGLSRDDERSRETIRERLVPFLMDIQPSKVVPARFGDGPRGTRLKLGPGGRNGISSDALRLPPAGDPGDTVTTAADVPQGVSGLLTMKTLFTDTEGWAVISDIDDTIKITQTSDPIGILRSTFVSAPTPTHGMPELYAFLHRQLGPRAPFFYLSASPYNLYPFLRGFRDAHYPFGPLILRDASWMSIPGLLSNLTLGTEDYKVDRMRKVHGWLPRKRLVCIGDSTQSDPEAYGTVYRQFPGWVRLILIRKVTDIAALGMAEKNEPVRFEKAFEGVPRAAWHVFEDPAECYRILEEAIAREDAAGR